MLTFRPEARLDILEARNWYEERASGLGTEFIRVVDARTAAILRFPTSFPKIHEDVRIAVLRRFPYALLYIVDENVDEIVVLACFHHRRDPARWQKRD